MEPSPGLKWTALKSYTPSPGRMLMPTQRAMQIGLKIHSIILPGQKSKQGRTSCDREQPCRMTQTAAMQQERVPRQGRKHTEGLPRNSLCLFDRERDTPPYKRSRKPAIRSKADTAATTARLSQTPFIPHWKGNLLTVSPLKWP